MVNLKLYAWVVRGKQRVAIIKSFSKDMTPSQIHKKCKTFNEKVSLNNTSDVLRSFVKEGIAICLNEEDRIGRIYQLTDEGEEIRLEILKE